MNNVVTKKEIKNYSRDFRTIANRTLNSNFDVFDGNLKRLINYIDNNFIISDFINSCKNDEQTKVVEIGANIATIISFVQPIINQ